jgi:hypothetical protein
MVMRRNELAPTKGRAGRSGGFFELPSPREKPRKVHRVVKSQQTISHAILPAGVALHGRGARAAAPTSAEPLTARARGKRAGGSATSHGQQQDRPTCRAHCPLGVAHATLRVDGASVNAPHPFVKPGAALRLTTPGCTTNHQPTSGTARIVPRALLGPGAAPACPGPAIVM